MFKTTPISVSEVENYIWGNEFMINATSRESIYPELLVVIQLNANNQIGKFQSTVNIFQGKVSVFKPYFIIWKWNKEVIASKITDGQPSKYSKWKW